MSSTISQEQLVEIMPECQHIIGKYVDPINEAFERFEINTPLRQAAFIAQCGHESTRFTRVEENLNYSANGLVRTFPSYFPGDTAKEFAYKPMRIANRVYANKGGNGDEASGDGWKYRGRGLIQVTLKRNYQNRGRRLVEDPQYFLQSPDLLLEPEWAVRSACDYWDENSLNNYADRDSAAEFRNLTRLINRALRGLDDRLSLWRSAKLAFGIPADQERS
jgi:putative chitinase